MNALIASESVASVRRGILTGTGAMSADLALGLLVYLVRSIFSIGRYVRVVYIIGAMIITYLGVTTALRHREGIGPQPRSSTFLKALAIGVTNPFQILWWLTAGLAFAYLGGIVLFAGLFAAIAVWIVTFPLILHAGTSRYERSGEAVRLISAALMFVFAGYFAFAAAGLI